MRFLDLTLEDPQHDLALEEALFQCGEEFEGFSLLRIWEPKHLAVVLGRGSQYAAEVHVELCRQRQIPIIRRCTGGATILAGPGCLMYTLVLPRTGDAHDVDTVHSYVLDRMAATLGGDGMEVSRAGTSDLTVRADGSKKFSGNSLRLGRNAVLYHGTVMYDLDVQLVAELLKRPPRMPDYRQDREHARFITNLNLSQIAIRQKIRQAWEPLTAWDDWPRDRTNALVAQKYGEDSWNLRH